jgi:magnesium transporter
MIRTIVSRDGVSARADHIDPAWLETGSGVVIWADLESPDADEARVLAEVFHFHELAVEDAISEAHHPKIESYDGYVYLVLHGIDFRSAEHRFATHDTDFFLGANYLVTVHDGTTRSVPEIRDLCVRNGRVPAEGPAALLHRIVDTMVDHYQPEVEKLEDKIDALEKEVFDRPDPDLVRRILDLKHDVSGLRRITIPERDVIGRLARREFPLVNEEVAYRFRDVHDHLVRLSDESLMLQDRITGILEAHVSNVSNRLNEVMKVLTVIATIFMPLTVLTGFYGMNVNLPHFPGGEPIQWWWIFLIMLVSSGLMLAWFRKKGWV